MSYLEITGIIANITVILAALIGLFKFEKIKKDTMYTNKVNKIDSLVLKIVEIEYNLEKRIYFWRNYSVSKKGLNSRLRKAQNEKGFQDSYPFDIELRKIKELSGVILGISFEEEIKEIKGMIDKVITDTIPLKVIGEVALHGGEEQFKEFESNKEFIDLSEKIRKELPGREKEILDKFKEIKAKMKKSLR